MSHQPFEILKLEMKIARADGGASQRPKADAMFGNPLTRPNPALRSAEFSFWCYGREFITVSHQPFEILKLEMKIASGRRGLAPINGNT